MRHEWRWSRELGYKRLVCAYCEREWPCPPRRIQIAVANDEFDPTEWADEDIAAAGVSG